MAPKKALPPPPSPEPEEEEEISEEEESEEGEYDESESDMEENGQTTPIQPSQVNNKPGIQKQTTPPPPSVQSSQSEEEEEGSESEEEEEEEESDFPPSPNVSDFTVKPILQTKRPSDSQKDDENDSRSGKKVKTTEGEEKKENGSAISASGGVGRVWSEEAQIALLQGLIDYHNKYGAGPHSDKDAFHEFIKRKLQADISKSQLYEKVRRLKKKYLTNVEKAESGEDLVFSKPHESKAFDLSKMIWGSGDGKKDGKFGTINGNVKEESVKDDLVIDYMTDDEVDIQSKYPFLSQSFDDGEASTYVISYLKKNLGLIDRVKVGEWEEKWKEIRRQEAELVLKKINLMTEQSRLGFNAGKKG